MPAEIVVNLHNGTDTVGGNANDINPLGTSLISLTDFNTGSDSGWDLTANLAHTHAGNGRDVSEAGDPAYYLDINGEGGYVHVSAVGAIEHLLSNIDANVISFDLTMLVCTTFSSQGDLTVSCGGQTRATWNSTGNVLGEAFTLVGCVPNGSNEATIVMDNNVSNFFFLNGYHIHNVIESGGPSSIAALRRRIEGY